jgi:1-deoxy-D-xylulose-5-phosphate synthase
LDESILQEVAARFVTIVTIEDGMIAGGLGGAVAEYLSGRGYAGHLERIGIPDTFVEHGAPQDLYRSLSMDPSSLAQTLRTLFVAVS